MTPPLVLYFYAGGKLQPVGRTGDPSVSTALRMLLAGPTPQEADALSTRLPRLSGAPQVSTEGLAVLIRFPAGTPALAAQAVRQVACTAGAAFREEPAWMEALKAQRRAVAVPDPDPGLVLPRPVAVPVKVLVDGPDWHTADSDADCPGI
jgi:hypothetical protein